MHQQNCAPRIAGSANQTAVMVDAAQTSRGRLYPVRHPPTGVLVNPAAPATTACPGNEYHGFGRHAPRCGHLQPVQLFSVEEQFTQRMVPWTLPQDLMLPDGRIRRTRILEDPYQFKDMPRVPMLPTRVEICVPFTNDRLNSSGYGNANASNECGPVVIIEEYATGQRIQRSRPKRRPRVSSPGVEIIDLDEYIPSVKCVGSSNAAKVHHVRMDKARGTRLLSAQVGITNAHSPTVIHKDDPGIIMQPQVRFDSDNAMSPRAADVVINNHNNPTVTPKGHSSSTEAQQLTSSTTWPVLPKGAPSSTVIKTHGGSTNCKWDKQAQQARRVEQSHRVPPQHSRVRIRSKYSRMESPRRAIPGFPVSVRIEPRDTLELLEQRNTLNALKTPPSKPTSVQDMNPEVGLRQAESIVANILDSFAVQMPESHTLANEDAAQPLNIPVAENIENLHDRLHVGPMAKKVKLPVSQPESAEPNHLDSPCRTMEDVMYSDKNKTAKNLHDVIECVPGPASATQTPASFTGVACYPEDIGEPSLPESTLVSDNGGIQTQQSLFDDRWRANEINKLIISLPNSGEVGRILPQNPNRLSGALWETEDVIKLMTTPSGGGKLEDDGAGLVAHSARVGVMVSADSKLLRECPGGSSSTNKRKSNDFQEPDATSPVRGSSQAKYQKCCCRKKYSGDKRAHTHPSTCDLVTMPWTEFFDRLEQNKTMTNSKKPVVSKKRKRNKLDECPKGFERTVRWHIPPVE